MACVNPPASVHAGVRVVAKASSSAGRRARADGILAASHRRRGAVRTPARWTAAAPFRGVHLFERRAPAPAHVLCEPSRADVGSDDELDPVAARAARDVRRRRASAEADALPERLSARQKRVGNKTNKTESRDPRDAALGLAEAKSTMRAMRQTQAVQTQATRAKTPARRDATETRARSKSGDAKEPETFETPRRAAEPEPVAPRPGPAPRRRRRNRRQGRRRGRRRRRSWDLCRGRNRRRGPAPASTPVDRQEISASTQVQVALPLPPAAP